uniref:C2H2-type domain-containing protein n=1 Tax=Timema monikensis TaxID=170555 RepID=A0A7R9EAJ4_9NEOP|nr:unnamed protein product [Timema monikensis]
MSQSEGNDSSLERARFPLYHHSKKNKKKGDKSSMRRHLSDNKMEIEEEVSKGGGSDTDGNIPVASDLPLCVPHLLAPAPVPCQSVITKAWSSPTPASSLQISGPSGTMPSISSRKEVQALPKRNEYTSAAIPKTVVCFICKEWFFSREKFIIHLVMNHRMVHCRHCQEIFETDDMRIIHERELHFPLECDICKCTVESTKELAEHYESDHDVPKSKKEDSNFGDHIDGSEKFNSDSSFEPSSDEFLVGSGGENEESDEEEEWKPDVIANLNDEPIEAQIDPTEVECVMNDTSDDEFYDDTSPIQADSEGSDNFISNMQINQEKIEAMIDSLNTGLDEESHEKSAETSTENLRKISTLSSGESQPLTLDTDTVEDQIEKMFQAPSKTTEQLAEPATSNGKVASRESWEAADVLMAIKQEPGTDVDGNFPFPSQKKNGKEMFCEICCGPCPGLEELLQHLNTVHNFSIMALGGESRFTCIEECDKIFNSQALLDKHKKEVHNITKVTTTFQCPFCAVQAETKITVRQHIFDFHNNDLMSEPPQRPFAFPCRCCSKKFWHVEERNQHQMDEHSDTIESFFKCYICLQSYTSKVCLNRHVLTTHPGEQRYSPLSYKCKLCLVMFPSVAKMCKHFQDSHPAALNMHSQARQRECHLCGKMLLSKRAYAIHFRMKHSAISRVGFRCRICQKRFDSKDERKLHYQMDHEGESPYHCTDCGKGFASKSGMYGHRQLHTGTGVSTCGYCGKAFTRKDSYNEHLLIHNGPRHKCPHCPKEFVQRSNLVRHIRIHTGEKPYKCLYCDKCFSDKGACNSHIRVHTREETSSCPYCGQTYSKKQFDEVFSRFVPPRYDVLPRCAAQCVVCETSACFTSVRCSSSVCQLCSKAFSLPGRLKAHIMTHTGVKHMKCLLCDKAYSVRKSLRKHLLEKHNVGHDHPHYKRCFYAMSPEEAGLDIPSDIPRVRVSPAGSEDEPAIPIFRKQEVKKKVKKPRGTGRRGRPPGSGKKQKQSGDPSLVTSPKRGRGRGRGRGGGRGRGRGRPPKSLSIVASPEPSTSTGRESQRVLRRKPSPKKFEIKQEPDSEEDSDSNNMLSMALQDEKSHSSTDSYEEKITKKRSVGNRKISPMEYHSSAPTLSPENKEMLLNLVGATGQKKRRVEAIVEILQKYTNTGAEGNSKDGTGEDIKDEDQRQATHSRHDKESTEDRGSSDEGEGLVGKYTKVDVQGKIKEEECSLESSSGSSIDQQDMNHLPRWRSWLNVLVVLSSTAEDWEINVRISVGPTLVPHTIHCDDPRYTNTDPHTGHAGPHTGYAGPHTLDTQVHTLDTQVHTLDTLVHSQSHWLRAKN